jgi:carbon storage regulator CsrA
MLVLSRRPGQKVVFPSLGITIEVLRARGCVTKLGFEAPANVPIMRDEVLAKPTADADAPRSATHPADDRVRRHNFCNASWSWASRTTLNNVLPK